jgi:hypothetical protein
MYSNDEGETTMTKEQIEQLRALIRCEIDYALQEENGYRFSYETKAFNDGAWESFTTTFEENCK